MDVRECTWDNNDNLLNDGTGTYTYNHANRLESAGVSGEPYTTFNYNGLGYRLEQTIDMQWTRYTLDLAGGLTQVLSDGIHTYLYGNGRIGEEHSANWQYHLSDGLGSVRQLTNQSGSVTLAKEYEPYGEVLDSAGSGASYYGYTGEWTDNTGLVYLRARYYDPTIGRFMTKDSWPGNMNQPMSYNAWLYVLANPIKFTDPFGFLPVGSPSSIQNDRDLTLWLYRELSTNVDSFYIQRIKTLLGGSIADKYVAINAWMWLVKDSAKWDFKRRIDREIGRAITFIDYQQGFRWYEYSVPGNIFYGYIGSAAGFSELMLHGGASYAEIIDPSHKERGESCCPSVCAGIYLNIGPFNLGIPIYCKLLGCYYFNYSWVTTYFDDPTDYSAIKLGIDLYKSYRNRLTFAQLTDNINSRGESLAHPSSIPSSFFWINPLGGWPYDVGRFNGPNDSVNESTVLRYLK